MARPTVTASVALVVVLVGALTAGCGESTPRAAAGMVLPDAGDGGGTASHFRVPGAAIDVSVGSPVGSAYVGQAASEKKWSAPDGGALVPVTVSRTPTASTAAAYLPDVSSRSSLVLLAGSHRYPVLDVSSDASTASVYVAVSDADAELTTALTYEGVTQTAPAGKSPAADPTTAPLYDQAGQGTDYADCPTVWSGADGTASIASCQVVQPILTPYLPGPGWAPSGQEYAVVPAQVTLTGRSVSAVDDPSAESDFTDLRLTATLDGQRPTGHLPYGPASSTATTLSIAETSYWQVEDSASSARTLSLRVTGRVPGSSGRTFVLTRRLSARSQPAGQ